MTEDIDARTAAREAALAEAAAQQRLMYSHENYVYDRVNDAYWELSTGQLLSANAVDASVPLAAWRIVDAAGEDDDDMPRRRGRRPRQRLIKPSDDIKRIENDRWVEGATWIPGYPRVISDMVMTPDGFVERQGTRTFNMFRPNQLIGGDPARAAIWVEHVKRLFPDPETHEYFLDYCAHMLQRPEEKANAAIVLSGKQGIGKDAILYPLRHAIGDWNAKNIDPEELLSNFRPWLQALMLVIDEVRPGKDEFTTLSMYNILKPIISAPPDVLMINEKYQKPHYVKNVVRVFMTTNNWMSMFLPKDDRRFFLMHSRLPSRWNETADPEYFVRFFRWVKESGAADVRAFLMTRDISKFNPGKPIEANKGKEAVIETWSEPDDVVSSALDVLERPDIVFGSELIGAIMDDENELINMMRSGRRFILRMERSGYVLLPRPQGIDKWRRDWGKLGQFKSAHCFMRETLEGSDEDLLKAAEARLEAIKAKREAQKGG